MAWDLASLSIDLRRAGRALRRRPLYFASSTLVLSAGLAATLAVFVVVRATQLAPLPFPEPDRLVTLDVTSHLGHNISVSIPNYYDWRDRSRTFERYGASAGWSLMLRPTGPGTSAEVLSARAVLGDFFDLLGFQAARGRLFSANETDKGAERVVVLSDGIWRRRFGADPDIVGKAIQLDGQSYVVLGVLAPGTGYPTPAVEVYFPMGSSADELPWTDRDSSFGTRILARLSEGTTLAGANADLGRVDREMKQAFGDKTAAPAARSLSDLLVGDRRDADRLLAALVFCFFAIAATNALLLALARGEERRGEMAVRSALGATAKANRKLLLAEAAWIVTLSALAGAGGAHLLLTTQFVGNGVHPLLASRLHLDGGAWLMAAALSGVALVALTLAPAKSMARDPQVGLRRRASGRGVLVAVEVALTLVLVALASLLVRSETLVASVDRGFATADVLTMRVSRATDFPDAASWRGTWDRVLEAARAVSGAPPGDRRAAATLLVPLAQRSWEQRVMPGERTWNKDEADSMLYNMVSEDYFSTLGVTLERGRTFTAADRDGSPLVAIVDDTLAAKYWPGQDPIGKAVQLEAPNSHHDGVTPPEVRTIVGVTRNVRHYELESASRIQVYVPFRQTGARFGQSLYLAVAIKDATKSAATEQKMREALRQVDPDLAATDVAWMSARFDDALEGRRAIARWSTLFGGLSLALALAGVFALTAYAVAQREREIAIRAALGADRPSLMSTVLQRSLRETAVGALLGAGLVLVLAPLARSLFFGISPFDPRGLGTALLCVVVGTLAAAAVPAFRAARRDPAQVLRSETIRG